MKQRVLQETVKTQIKQKSTNCKEYFTMASFMKKVNFKEEFEIQTEMKKIDSTLDILPTIDGYAVGTLDLGVEKEKVSECSGEIRFNHLPLMPEQSHEEDPDYSPEQKNENDLECFSKLDQADTTSSNKEKMVPFSSATFPEDEDNDPDFNPLELKKKKTEPERNITDIDIFNEPLSSYSLTQNYGGFSQTSSMPLIDNYQNELETKPVYCKEIKFNNLPLMSDQSDEEDPDYLPENKSCIISYFFPELDQTGITRSKKEKMVTFSSATFLEDENNDPDFIPCESKKKKLESEKSINDTGMLNETLSTYSISQNFCTLSETNITMPSIDSYQNELEIKPCSSKKDESPTFKINFPKKLEHVCTEYKNQNVKLRLSDLRKDKLNEQSNFFATAVNSLQPNFLAKRISKAYVNRLITKHQIEILKTQIIQHVQLYCQTYLMTKNCAELQLENSESIFMLEELKRIKNSLFHPTTLEEALEITKQEVDTNVVLQSHHKKTKNSTYSLQICNIMASSSVFQFSQLLPRKFCLFHKTTKPRMNKAIMTDYEDRLLALQLFNYKEKLPWSKYEMIQKFLMPCRTAKELKTRVDNCRDKKLNVYNPIYEAIKLNIKPVTPPILKSDFDNYKPDCCSEDLCLMQRKYEPEWMLLLKSYLIENKNQKSFSFENVHVQSSSIKAYENEQNEIYFENFNKDIEYICKFSKVYVKQLCDYEKNKSIKKVVDWSKTLTDVSIIPKREIKLQFLEELQTHSIVHYLGFFPYLIKCQQTYQKNDVSKKIKELVELLGCLIRSNKNKTDILLCTLEKFYLKVQYLLGSNLSSRKMIKNNIIVLNHLKKFFLEQKTSFKV